MRIVTTECPFCTGDILYSMDDLCRRHREELQQKLAQAEAEMLAEPVAPEGGERGE